MTQVATVFFTGKRSQSKAVPQILFIFAKNKSIRYEYN